MDVPLTDFSPEVIIPAIDDALVAFWSLYTLGQGGYLGTAPDAVQVISGAPNAGLNGVYRARLGPGDADSRIAQILAPLKGHHPFVWWVGPACTPADLVARLEAHGLQRRRTVPGMAIRTDGAPPPESISGVIIRPAASVDEYLAGTPILTESFNISPTVLPTLAMIERAIWDSSDAATHIRVNAWVGDQVAATGSLTAAGSVASIDAIATSPAFRGRGLGRAVTLALISEAQQRGYAIAVLEASEMGLPVYQRIGFTTFCEYAVYWHTPEN